MEAMGGPPLTVGDYLRELVARLRTALGDELLGVYAGGSFALGDFDQSLSDLDVAAVTATHAGRTTKQAIVELLRHESLPCPARGLEFVLYAEPVIHTATTDPGFELNLNSGARMSFRADYEPGEERHWFAIDRSVLAARRRGPEPRSRALSAETMKMPEPIIEPTTSAMASNRPIPRRSGWLKAALWLQGGSGARTGMRDCALIGARASRGGGAGDASRSSVRGRTQGRRADAAAEQQRRRGNDGAEAPEYAPGPPAWPPGGARAPDGGSPRRGASPTGDRPRTPAKSGERARRRGFSARTRQS